MSFLAVLMRAMFFVFVRAMRVTVTMARLMVLVLVLMLVLMIVVAMLVLVIVLVVVLVAGVVILALVLIAILECVDDLKLILFQNALDAGDVELEAEALGGGVGELANDDQAARLDVRESGSEDLGAQLDIDVVKDKREQQHVDECVVAAENLVELGAVGALEQHGTDIFQLRRFDASLKVGNGRRRDVDADGAGEHVERRVGIRHERQHIDAVGTAKVEQTQVRPARFAARHERLLAQKRLRFEAQLLRRRQLRIVAE